MSCEYEERISLYVGGDLATEESAAAERHMAGCADCASLAGELPESQAVLKSLAHAEPGRAIRTRVLETLESRRRRRNWLAAAAALFVLLAAGLAWDLRQRMAAPQMAILPPRPPAVQPPPVKQAAALPERPRPPVRRRAPRPKPEPVQLAQNTEPLVVKMLTDDPDVVIIWLVDGKEQQNEETSFGDDTRGE